MLRFRWAILAILLTTSGGGIARASTNQHVILITIDGLAAFYLSDPQASLPTLRKLAAEGAVADALRVSNPSVTWPNHATLLTGVQPAKHSVLFNGILVRSGPGEAVRIDGFRDQKDLVPVPMLYDRLHRLGYRTANVNWPCTRGAAGLDDNFPDVPEQLRHMTSRLRDELIAARILKDDDDATFRNHSAAARDEIWTATAIHLLERRKPNFLMFHLLVTDSIQHLHGPQSAAAYTAVALADAHLARIVQTVKNLKLEERTTIFVMSDHGFEKPTKLVNPNVVFRKAGLQRPGRIKVMSISEGGTAFVYLTDGATAAADRSQAMELLRGHEGIAQIIGPEGFEALNLPNPSKNPQMCDLLLVAADGYAFSNESFDDNSISALTSAYGSHGYLASNPKMNGVFVAWGQGIKPGVKLGTVDNIDVAPTIAAVLGEAFPTAEGKPLIRILRTSEKLNDR